MTTGDNRQTFSAHVDTSRVLLIDGRGRSAGRHAKLLASRLGREGAAAPTPDCRRSHRRRATVTSRSNTSALSGAARVGARGQAVGRSARVPRGGSSGLRGGVVGLARCEHLLAAADAGIQGAGESVGRAEAGGQAPCDCPGHRRRPVDRRCAIPLVVHAVGAVSLVGGWAANRAAPPWRTATPCGSAGNRSATTGVVHRVTGWGGLCVLGCFGRQRWRALA
jgi:hypothetical protein